jgi:hypothetical protein
MKGRKNLSVEEKRALVVLKKAEIGRIDAAKPGVKNLEKSAYFEKRAAHFSGLARYHQELGEGQAEAVRADVAELQKDIQELEAELSA